MRKTLAFGATALLATTMVACTGAPASETEPIAAVYGPPPTELREVDKPIDDVYGPPSSFEKADDAAYDYGDEVTTAQDGDMG